MPRKAFDATITALPEQEGTFTAYASCFGNRDLHGETVMRGAFKKSLHDWAQKGRPIPLLWGHNLADPDYNIGRVLAAAEDERGLLVTAQLDLDNPKAAQVHRLLKQGRVGQMSFAFDVLDHERVKDTTLLKELALHEVSVVPLGANPKAEVLSVKAGRAISARNEAALRDALGAASAAVEALLAVLPAEAEDPGDDPPPPDESPAPEPKSAPKPEHAPPMRLLACELALLDTRPAEHLEAH